MRYEYSVIAKKKFYESTLKHIFFDNYFVVNDIFVQ